MLKDNRYYQRTLVSVPAILHEKASNREISCMVRDISENGICFEVPVRERNVDSLSEGGSLHFQFIDTYQYGKEVETDVLSNDGRIRYMRLYDDVLRVGCYVTGDDFKKYAVRREVVRGYNRTATA